MPLEETMTFPPHPPRDARHLLLKEKALAEAVPVERKRKDNRLCV